MPIYEYQCEACGAMIEELQKISDPPLEDCPKCNEKKSLHRLISNSSFILKGTGWYETDFKDKSESKGKNGSATHNNGADKKENKNNGNGAEKAAKTETKNEKKKDKKASEPAASPKSEKGASSAKHA